MHPWGFTIIELAMVIVLIAILAALAIPRFDSFYSIKLEGAARKLVADIRYTQRLAIALHDDYGVEFNTSAETYRVYRVSDNATATEPLSRSAYQTSFAANSEFQGIDISSASFGGTQHVRFNSLGTPRDGNNSVLSSNGTVVLSYKGNSRTITVTPNTSKVTLQ